MPRLIELPAPGAADGLAALLMARRSVREYAGGALTLEELASLLWAGQGISHSSGKRAAPSAHGLSPLALYLAAGEAEGLDPGLYRYDPRAHALDTVGHGDLRPDLYRTALEDQPWVDGCAALIVIAGDTRRMVKEFADQPPDGERGRRYIFIEAGAAAQNIALQAVELNLGSVMVGGFHDDQVGRCLGIEAQPLLMLPLGRLPK